MSAQGRPTPEPTQSQTGNGSTTDSERKRSSLRLPNCAGNKLPLATTRPIFTVIIIVLALIIIVLAAALVTPKDARTTHESLVEKERDDLRRRQKA